LNPTRNPCEFHGLCKKSNQKGENMKRAALIGLWIFATTLAASAQTTTFFYPHVINGSLGIVTWRTTILLTNPSATTSAVGAITFTKDNADLIGSGTSWAVALTDQTNFTVTSSVFSFTLPPGATRKWVTTSTGGLISGFANVTVNAGTVSGTAIFSEFDFMGNLVGEAGMPAVNPVLRQSILVDTLAKYGVGVAYANPGTSTATISLSLLDDFGAVIAGPVSLSMGSFNHTQGFVNQFFPSAPPLVGTMQISSNTPLIAIALRFDPTLQKFTTLPAVTLTSLLNTGIEWLEDRRVLPTAVATLLETLRLRRG
jgi:hypothetical protein